MIEELKELLRKNPFHPFKIIMADGREYDVTSPYQVAMNNTTVGYFFPNTDTMAFLRHAHITTLQASTIPDGQ